MIVTAYNNGAHHESGAGYGLRIRKADRERYFSRNWQNLVISLPNGQIATPNLDKGSFWGDCRELINQEIGGWLRSENLAPWPDHKPPKLNLEPSAENRFSLNRGKN